MRRPDGRWVLTAVLAAVTALTVLSPLSSSDAWALCPNCLGQNRSLTPTLQLLGLFLLLPFMVALVVARMVARAVRRGQSSNDEGAGQGAG